MVGVKERENATCKNPLKGHANWYLGTNKPNNLK